MNPTEILSAEHRVIEGVLDCLLRMAEQAEREARLDARDAASAIEFLRGFADGCHHGKEERHLFATLIAKGWPSDGGPVGVMLTEHELGRGLIRRMEAARAGAEAGKAEAHAEFAAAARGYVELLRAHIQKEERVLFPMADQALSAAEQQRLLAAFERTETQELGEVTHDRMLAIADELAERYGTDPAQVAAAGCGCGRR
jgi:hemerythrin-like domain-containing protein